VELRDLLLKPCGAQLQGKSKLAIVPDGVLWSLPFQALPRSPNRYLIEDCAISYAPSLRVLREMARRRQRQGKVRLLAFGNPELGGSSPQSGVRPVLMDEKLQPLPEAEKQVKALGRLYGAERSRIYIGAEARERTLKAEAGSYAILHLATHG